MALQRTHPLLGRMWLTASGDTPYVHLDQVSNDWDFIFLDYADATTSSFTFESTGACFKPDTDCPDHDSETDFVSAVKSKVSAGVNVALGVGTSMDQKTFAAKTSADLDHLVAGISDVVDAFGFNGAVVDCAACSSDVPVAGYCDKVVSLLKKLRTKLGSNFTLAVQHALVQDFTSDNLLDTSCTCPSVFNLAADNDTVVDLTFIDFAEWSDSFADLYGAIQYWNSSDGLAAVADLFIHASTLAPAALPPQRLVIGTAGGIDANADTRLAALQHAMSCITKGSDCDSYRPRDGPQPSFVGFLDRDYRINDDELAQGKFRKAMKPFLVALPGGDSSTTTTPSGSSTESAASSSTSTSSKQTKDPDAPTSPTDDATPPGTPRSTIVAAVAGVCVAILVLVLGASAWYFRRRRNRRRQLQASGSPRPYGMRTPQGTSVVGSGRREEKQVALGFEGEQKAASSALASTEQDRDGASGSMEALHGAVLRAGFSVDTLMHSLGRVHAEQHPLSAEGGRVQSFVTTDSPPTYVEDDTSVRRRL